MKNIDEKLYIEDFVQYTDKVIDLYLNERLSMNKIADLIGANYYIVRKILRTNNIERRTGPESNWKIFNEYWLDELDTQEKLYFLGFFAADGNSYNKKTCFCISKIDEEILIKFNEVLSGTSVINYRKPFRNNKGYVSAPSCMISFHSEYFVKKLEELGFPPRKTKTLKFPDWITKEQFWPFIRGYFDGDGCFSKKTDKAVKVTIESSISFLTTLKEKLLEYGINSSISYMKDSCNEVGRLDIQSQKSVRLFMDNIYKDSTIHLSRKYERYYSYFYEHKPIVPYKKSQE